MIRVTTIHIFVEYWDYEKRCSTKTPHYDVLFEYNGQHHWVDSDPSGKRRSASSAFVLLLTDIMLEAKAKGANVRFNREGGWTWRM